MRDGDLPVGVLCIGSILVENTINESEVALPSTTPTRGETMFGGGEMVMVLAVIVMLFGSSQIPKLAKNLGEAQRELKKGLAGDDADATVEASTPAATVTPDIAATDLVAPATVTPDVAATPVTPDVDPAEDAESETIVADPVITPPVDV